MPEIPEKDLKRYYSIGEVAEMFDVSKSLIRYWEGEFGMLKPHKNAKGDRRFTPQNIEQLRTIYHLVKERGFTISGAREELDRQRAYNKEKEEVIKRLQSLRKGLEEMRDGLAD